MSIRGPVTESLKALLEIPEGTYFIGLNSDDGGYISMPRVNFTNTVKQVVRIELDDLLKPENVAQLRAVFFEPKTFRAPQTPEQVTQEAASEFATVSR